MPLAATTAPPPMARRPGPGRMSIGTPTSMIAPPTAVCTAPPMRLGFFLPEAGPPSIMVALTEAACAASFPYDGARNPSPSAGRPLRAASLALATGLTSMIGLWSLIVSSLMVGGGSKPRVCLRLYGLHEAMRLGAGPGDRFVTVR